MRLMLGDSDNRPSLLVVVDNNFDPFNFKFRVINGGWDGKFKNGNIYVDDKCDNKPVGHNVKILTEEQDRLRGDNTLDYQKVFDNWDNLNYVGPEFVTTFDDMDDDIPF